MKLKETPVADHFDPLEKRNLARIRLLVRPPPTDLPVALAERLLPLSRLENDFRPYREFAQRAVSHYMLVDKARPKLECVELIRCEVGLDLQDDLRLIGRTPRSAEWLLTEKILRSENSCFCTTDKAYRASKSAGAPEPGASEAMNRHGIRSVPWPLGHTIVRATEARILLLSLLEPAVASREWAE